MPRTTPGRKLSTNTYLYYFRKIALCLVLAGFLSSLPGCSSITFYTQAVIGQTSLLLHREDIDHVIAGSDIDEITRNKLQLVKQVLNYAENDLNLPVGDSYSTYVATGKSYVVWNVFAAPEFSLEMKTFCYPIAGCVSYRGYFRKRQAENLAAELGSDGYDAFVGGVAAYSTLGWFSDPVLDTFLRRSDVDLAALLFHELAHRAVYVSGDTQFNESFATTIEGNALKKWLAYSGQEQAYLEYVDRRNRREQVLDIIGNTRKSLGLLYSSEASTVDKRERKRSLIDELRIHYQKLQASWNGESDYQSWMTEKINNAKLGTITEYNIWVPAFNVLLVESNENISQFIEAVATLSKLDEHKRNEFLSSLLQE